MSFRILLIAERRLLNRALHLQFDTLNVWLFALFLLSVIRYLIDVGTVSHHLELFVFSQHFYL